MLKVEKNGRQVELDSVERKSVERAEIEKEAFGLMVGWKQAVEDLAVLIVGQHLHLVKVCHFLAAYGRS